MPREPFAPTEGLRVLAVCPLCDVHYNPLEAHVIDERENAHLLHLTCRNCGGAVLAAVQHDRQGVHPVGLLTDLTSEDVRKFKDRTSAVTDDDVLALHSMLTQAGAVAQLTGQ